MYHLCFSYLLYIRQNWSEYPINWKFVPLGYQSAKLGVLTRYLKILFTATKCDSLGHDWNLEHIHTLNNISSLEEVKYNNDPIILLYNLWSTHLPFSSLSILVDELISVFAVLLFSIPNFFNISLMYFVWLMKIPSLCCLI